MTFDLALRIANYWAATEQLRNRLAVDNFLDVLVVWQ